MGKTYLEIGGMEYQQKKTIKSLPADWNIMNITQTVKKSGTDRSKLVV